MRFAAVLPVLLLALPAAVGAAADGPGGETCTGLLVCADATARTSATCTPRAATVTCEFVFYGGTGGRSPLLLPGFASSSLDAILDWHCVPAVCAPGELVDNVNALVTWPGGPATGLLPGLYPGESFEVEVLHENVTIAAANGPACLHFTMSQESTVIARVPYVHGAAIAAIVSATDGAGDVWSGAACTL